MTTNVGRLEAQLTLNAAQFQAALSGVQGSIGALQTRLTAFQATAGRLGMAMTIGITLPVLAVGGAMLKMAADAMESENLFTVSMKGMADAARQWSEEVSDAFGLNAYELRRQLGTWNIMLRAMGANEEAALGMSKALTMLAQDLASVANVKVDEAFRDLRSGMMGQTEPMQKYGVVMLESSIRAYALEAGIIAVDRELTESEKILARYGLILQRTSDYHGDLANTMDSPINTMRRLQAQVQALMISIGMEFMPVASAALTWLANTGFPNLKSAVERMKTAWGEMGAEGQRNILIVAALLIGGGPLLKAISISVRGLQLFAQAFMWLRVAANAEIVAIGVGIGALAVAIPKLSQIIHDAIGGASRGMSDYYKNMGEAAERAGLQDVAKGFFDAQRQMLDYAYSHEEAGRKIKTVQDELVASLVNAVPGVAGFNDILADLGNTEGQTSEIAANMKKTYADLMASIYGDMPTLDQFKGGIEATGDKAEAAADALKEAGISAQNMAQAFAASHPMVQMLGLRIVGLQDQLAGVNAAIEGNASAQRAIQDAIRGTRERIGQLSSALSEAKARLTDLANVRLTGMGALDDQIFALEQNIKRIQYVAAGGILPAGMAMPTGALTALQSQLAQLQLLRQITFEPQLRAIQAAAQPPAAEMTFAAAIASISATKASIAGLEGQLVSANAVLRSQESALRDIQREQDALRESAAGLQKQIAAAEQAQRMMTDALVKAVVWMLEGSEKAKIYGGAIATQAGVIDDETKEMLRLFANFSMEHSSTTITDVQAAVLAWQNARDEIDRIAAGIRGSVAGIGSGTLNIPHGAAGGIVTRPTLALIGEAGPEAIVPLSGSRHGALGGATVNIYVAGSVVTERDLALMMRDELVKLQARNRTVGLVGA